VDIRKSIERWYKKKEGWGEKPPTRERKCKMSIIWVRLGVGREPGKSVTKKKSPEKERRHCPGSPGQEGGQ